MIVLTYAKQHVSKAAAIHKKALELQAMVFKNFGEDSYQGRKVKKLTDASLDCEVSMKDMMDHIEQTVPRSGSRKKRK